MQYRTMPQTGDRLSALGFGCMRLPERNRRIDVKRATRQIHAAIEQGVNYFDTAPPYHFGQSEPFLGEALAGGFRERVRLATKLTPHGIHSSEDMNTLLNSQLKRLKTDRIDYYLLHGMDEKSWSKLQHFDVLRFLDRAKSDGRIINAGFSFHDHPDIFKEMVDAYHWHFCQIQYNYLDEFNQAGRDGLNYAAAKNLGVVIMEPLRGGALGGPTPPAVQAVFRDAKVPYSPAEWALRWVWNHPEVTLVLSGMNEESHLKENLRIAAEALPNAMTDRELAVVERARDVYLELMKVGCTACRYCMPCPSGVDIPWCFEIYNRRTLFKEAKLECLVKYSLHLGGLEKDRNKRAYASQCTECGKCLNKCPQHLAIPELLKEVSAEFETWFLKLLLLYGRYFFPRLKKRKS